MVDSEQNDTSYANTLQSTLRHWTRFFSRCGKSTAFGVRDSLSSAEKRRVSKGRVVAPTARGATTM